MVLHSMVLFASTAAVIPLDALVTAFVFLYIGPELILPIASFIASIVGVLLMFWRYIVRMVRKLFRRITGRADEPDFDDLDAEIDAVNADDVDADAVPILAAQSVENADAKVEG